MQINPHWAMQAQALLVACGGLVLYVVGMTVSLQTVGAAICAFALLLVVFNFAMEIIRTWKRRERKSI